jgi:hypothetical protein
MTIRKSLSTAVLALCTVVAVPAMGQTSSSRSNTNTQNSQSQQAGKAVAKAQADVNKLQTDLNKIRAKVHAQVLQKPEWAQVVNERKAAETALDVARKSALNGVHNKPEYKTLQKDRDDAQQIVSQFNVAGSGVTQADFDKASTTVVNSGFAMKNMENAALKDDPKYAEAKTQLEAAEAKMKEVDSQVDVALKDDQEYQNTSKQLETAKTALTTAKTQLAQARQQEEAARQAQAKSRQQQQNSGSGGYGR